MSEQNGNATKKILVADDDRNFRVFLRTLLEGSGYLVVEAEDGIKTMLRIMDESPDLVTLDLAMPTISGHRVTELMNSVPDIRNIPFIVISGDAKVGKTRLELLGAADVFPKPFDKDKLLNSIESILSTATLEIIEEKSETDQPSAGPQASPPKITDKADDRDWFESLRNGSPDQTIEQLNQAVQQRPDDLKAVGYLRLAESLVVRNFCSRYEDPGGVVPRLDPKLGEEITKFSLNPAEGFLLSQMDGNTDLESLFFVSGMNRFRTCLLLEKLLVKGIVLLENGKVANA